MADAGSATPARAVPTASDRFLPTVARPPEQRPRQSWALTSTNPITAYHNDGIVVTNLNLTMRTTMHCVASLHQQRNAGVTTVILDVKNTQMRLHSAQQRS